METQICIAIVSLVEVVIMIIGFIIAAKEYFSTKRNETVNKLNNQKEILINQIIAYYSEEQEAIKWINDISPQKIPNLQQKLREKAQNNENNPDKIYPKFTANKAMSFLNHI